jgi:hypothetical protein
MMRYEDFLASKAPRAPCRGLSRTPALSSHLFGFQRHCVEFLLGVGSGGLFLDTGLGKTLVQLEYSEHARQASNGWALILTPLAVAKQIEREARKFGYDARVIRDQSEAREGINICNYDRQHLLEPHAFGSIALDEASILKSFDGKTSRALIDAFAAHRWRVPATATPAPNDHMELGQYADFCGVMQSNEMLSRFFINDSSQASQVWRLKRHGVEAFWDWMASWCRLAQLPSDLGGDDEGFSLPPVRVERHRAAESAPTIKGGLFGDEVVSATNLHEIKRATIGKRAKLAAEIVYNWQPCGNQNTPRGDAPNTNPTQLNGNVERGREERQRTTGNTCQLITESIPIDSSEQQSNKLCGMSDAVYVTRPIQSSNQNASHMQRLLSEVGEPENSSASLSSDQSDSPKATTPHSSKSNEDVARSADVYQRRDLGQTTATRQEPPEDCSAIPVTSRLGYSKTAWSLCKEPWCIWVDTDYEQNEVESAIAAVFGKDSFFSVRGSQPSEVKEASIYGWIDGARPIMISKPSILGYGLNFQHCAKCLFVGRSFSYETWYQAVRRFWRFGQQREVQVHLVVAEGEDSIARVIERKAADHDSMKFAMRAAMKRNNGKVSAIKVAYSPTHKGTLPRWIA